MKTSRTKKQDQKTKAPLLEKLFCDGLLKLGLVVHWEHSDEQIL